MPFIVGFSREPTGLVHIFIDNSNVEIGGKKMVSKLENVFEDQLCIDYGRLLGIVRNGRQMGDNPTIIGSRPPPNDSLWKEIEYLGFRVEVYDLSDIDHREKEVDSELGASICDAIQEHKRPGIIVLVAGDRYYGPMLRRALLRNWTVEIWFWTKGMSYRLEHINVPHRPDLQTMILYLDPYYLRFIYAYGRTREKRFLEIEEVTGTWDHKQMTSI